MAPLDRLREISSEVDRACILLTSPAPESLDKCSAALESAAARLASLQPALPTLAGDPELVAETWLLRHGILRAEALLANAAAWHSRWREIVAVRTAGYRRDGAPAEPPAPGRLCLTG
jgi:hypothetical protein